MSAEGSPKYRPDVDGLRAVAVLAVVAFHAFPGLARGGFVGVDVFFVISGFLISTIIIQNLERDRFSFKDFYVRRVRRIFPALTVVLFACLAVGWFTLLPDEYAALGKHVAGGAGYSANFVLLSEAGYFDTSAAEKPLLHLWSLGIEEQFYFVWPLLLYSARRSKIAVMLAIVLVSSFALNMVMVGGYRVATFYAPVTRFWELLIGSSLAYLVLHEPSWVAAARAKGRHALSIGGALLVAVAALRFNADVPFPGWRALLPTVGAAMWIAAGPDAVLNRFVLGNRLMVWVGLISYPLYLWHWPLLTFARILEGAIPSPKVRLAAVAIAFVLSYATYRFLETPIRHGTWKRGVVSSLLAASAVLFALGLVVHFAGGFAAARGPWNVDNVSRAFDDKDQFNDACRSTEAPLFSPKFDPKQDFCHSNRPTTTKPDVVVVGDSHAGRIYSGITAATTLAAVDLGRGSCVPLAGYEATNPGSDARFGCSPTMGRLIDRAIELAPRTVVLSGFFARNYDGRVIPDPSSTLRDLMRATFARLAKGGARVVVVLDVPELPFAPSRCVDRPYKRGAAGERCPFDRAVADRARALYEPDLRAATEGLDVTFFDPAAVLCDASSCFGVLDRNLLYDDPHHLSRYGATLVAKSLAPLLSSATP